MTEKEKMEAGMWYQEELDDQLSIMKEDAARICLRFNLKNDLARRETVRLLTLLLAEYSSDTVVLAPFHADYGSYTRIGKGVLIFQNCHLQDGGGITIKDRCFIGANCSMHTDARLCPADSYGSLQKASPILIEEDVWIGTDVTILQGVTIGKGAVIGAGSLIDRDIPAGAFVTGNPCRIIDNRAQG